jgi:hypothetical protein
VGDPMCYPVPAKMSLFRPTSPPIIWFPIMSLVYVPCEFD